MSHRDHEGTESGEDRRRQELYALLQQLRPTWEEKSRRRPPATVTAAAWRGNLDAARLFLDRGADLNERTRGFASPLVAAASVGDLAMVDFLLRHGALPVPEKANVTPLEAAAGNGHFGVVLRLLAAGASPSPQMTDQLAQRAQRAGDQRIHDYLAGQPPDYTPETTRRRSVTTASSSDAELEARQRSIDRVCELIVAGTLAGGLDRPRSALEGDTPLCVAAEAGLVQVVEALLGAGATPDAETETHRSTALMEAAREGHLEIVERLLAAGADVDHRNHLGQTALLHAAEWGDPEIVRVLLRAGADPAAQSHGGETATKTARGVNAKEIKSLLRKAVRLADRETLQLDASTGVRTVGRVRRDDWGAARGALDFLHHARQGEPEWSLAAVQANCNDSTRILADLVQPRRILRDVAERHLTAAADYAYVLQLKQHEWSLYLRSLGWVGLEEAEATLVAAKALSDRLQTRALSFVADDTSGAFSLRIFEKGDLVEEADCENGGELLRFRSRLRDDCQGLSGKPDAIDRFFTEQGIYLPPCRFFSDGYQNRLELEGIPKDAVAQVDFMVLGD